MNRKIIGATVGMGLPKPNLTQDDPTKGNYVNGRSEFIEQAQRFRGNTFYYIDETVEYPVDGEVLYSANPLSLSDEGRGIKVGDFIISSNDVMCKVTEVTPGHVSYCPIAQIGGSGGGEWELLADLEFTEATVTVRITEFPDGGSLKDCKRFYIEGAAVRTSDGVGGQDGVSLKTSSFGAGGIILCYGQSTAGTVYFRTFIERVGDYITPYNMMASHGNGYGALVYKTGYNDTRGGSLLYENGLYFGAWTAATIFGPGSKLKIWAVRK